MLISGIGSERLAKLTVVPLQTTLKDLSHELFDCYIELGVELELKISDIIAISVDNASISNKMYSRNYDILRKWTQSNNSQTNMCTGKCTQRRT